MFATHYHELMQLPEELAHARNLNVAVRETGNQVIFLHHLEAGGTNRSYGIHVAQLAGLPAQVVSRAREVLKRLEGEHRMVGGSARPETDPSQLVLFGEAARLHPVVTELKELDLDRMTPIEALNTLAELKRKSTP
jgi:DNA mismatch repair protein MutS